MPGADATSRGPELLGSVNVTSAQFGNSAGIRSGLGPNTKLSWPKFCKSSETPIAVISTLSRGAFRNGRYASRSIVKPMSPQETIDANRIDPPIQIGGSSPGG